MPKIPLYNEGTGPTQGLAAGQLSPRASTSAFTAPGRAFAGFQQTLSKAGKVAADFALAEKDAQTTEAKSDMTIALKEEWQTYNRNDKSQTVSDYQNFAGDFQKDLKTRLFSSYENFTPKQKSELSRTFDELSLGFSSAGANIAFTRQQANRANKANKDIETHMELMRSVNPQDAVYTYYESSLKKAFEDFRLQGLKIKYDETKVFQDIKKGNTEAAIAAATTPQELDAILKENEKDNTISSTAKQQIRNLVNVKKTKVETELKKEVVEQFFTAIADAPDDLILKADEELFDRIIKGEQLGAIDFSVLEGPERDRLVTRIKREQSSIKAENTEQILTSLRQIVDGASVAQLNAEKDNVIQNTGLFQGNDDDNLRTKALAIINSELNQKEDKVKEQINVNQKNIIDSLSISKGSISEELKEIINETENLYISMEDTEGAEAFRKTILSAQEAGSLFKDIEFSNTTDINRTINELNQEVRELAKTNPERVTEKLNTIKILGNMLETRNQAIATDPVRYLQEQKGELNTFQRISFQRQLGIAEIDIRLTTDAEMSVFKNQYDSAEDYNEKSRIGNEFINSFGEENSAMVLRNMMNRGVITIVDNIIIANPNNAYMFDVDAANSVESVKRFKQELTTDQRDATTEAVRQELSDYSRSIIGGGFEDVLQRTATDKRAAHVFAMRDVVKNTAFYYMSISDIDPKEAAKKAADAVINSQYSFIQVKNNSVRLKKGLDGFKEQIGTLLEKSIGDLEKNYLLDIIEVPTQVGIQESITDEEYITDIINEGRWVTTTDNSGVYLIDKTGNLVRRKSDNQLLFIEVKFSDLISGATQLQEKQQQLSKILNPGTADRQFINNPLQFIGKLF